MGKAVTPKQAIKIAYKLRQGGKIIVLSGGCFDILHEGHLLFLENAKRQGDTLFIFLESDENVRRLKGEDRPINSQEIRAQNLSALSVVDFIVKLPKLPKDSDYDRLIAHIRPSIIAITEGDPNLDKRKKQAEMAEGIVKSVTRRTEHSTTKFARSFKK